MAEEGRPEFACNACLVSFETHEAMRAHYKTDWHIYNSRRKVAGLVAISKDIWDQKWKEIANASEAAKGTNHIKEKKDSEKEHGSKVKKERAPWKLGDSLFDDRKFSTVAESLAYMKKQYSFILPDENYITDINALLTRLAEMIEVEHRCIWCGRYFSSYYACRQHMVEKRHARIGSENDDIMAELEKFYDYRASIAEYKFKSKEKQAKVKQLLENLENEKQKALADIAEEGEDDEDMEIVSGDEAPGSEWEEVDEEIDDEELIRMAEMGEDAEILQCEDEAEFERVMAELGLRPAEILPSGDLCLPNGKTVVHRDMAYIYRQRGQKGRIARAERVQRNQLMLADGASGKHGTGYGSRTLMKKEKDRHPWMKIFL